MSVQHKHTAAVLYAADGSVICDASDITEQADTSDMIYSVSQKIPPRGLVAIFPKRLGIFQQNFTCLLCVPIYTILQIFIQLSPTVMKLCHIKCHHRGCVSVDGGHFEHIMVVALNMS